MIIVYHMSDNAIVFSHPGTLAAGAEAAWIRGDYVPVAVVAGDDLEEAWKATQNGVVSPSWSREPPQGLMPIEPSFYRSKTGEFLLGRRSSMVGDIFDCNGVRYVVGAVGFEPCDAVRRAITQ